MICWCLRSVTSVLLLPQACLSHLVRDLMSSLSILSGMDDPALQASELALVDRILLPTLRVACK